MRMRKMKKRTMKRMMEKIMKKKKKKKKLNLWNKKLKIKILNNKQLNYK